MNNIFNNKHLFSKRMCVIAARISFVVISAFVCVQSFAQSEAPHQPLPLLEGNPIWEYKYEHIPTPRSDDWMKFWVDTGDRSFTYYFLGRQKEIDGKTYTMMGEIVSRGEDITFNRWYPVREEDGIVYTITDSLSGVVEHVYNYDYEIPYLQEGNECILYNFGAEIGDKLDKNNVVKSFDTYQLMDGTECRVQKTSGYYLDLYERLGYLNQEQPFGIMDPLLDTPLPLNGHVYVSYLNAYYQDDMMLYKAPDAREGLCVNDTCWTRDDAGEYARSYKADPRREEVFAYIQQLQKVTAWEVNIDGLSYLLDPDKHEAIISNGNKCSGELDIPSEVVYEGQTFVTKSMLWNAFYNCTGLTKVRIPKTIETVIHYYPGSILEEPTSVTMLKASDYMNIFRGCLSLEAIEVDVDNPIMCSDNGVLFSKDKTCLYCYPAGISRESFTIPETVTRIGAYAISNNKSLVSLTIPGSVTQICGYTIMYCLALTDVYYPSEEVPVTSRFAFAGSNIPHATLHVPAGSVDAYKSTAPWDFFGNIVALQNPVTFTEGQMATIVLPTEPDASKGKYYRLAGCKEGEIVFEQELQPRAHVPYIIVPHEDFSIDPAELELAGLTGDTVSVDGVRFIGTYMSEVLPSLGGDGGGFYYDIIDQTSDCSLSPSGETGKQAVVGALRAYLLVDWRTAGWNDPYTQGGTKSPWEKMPIVLRDDATSIGGCPQMVNGKLSNDKRYDLQGRRTNKKPARGIYIEGGKVKARP